MASDHPPDPGDDPTDVLGAAVRELRRRGSADGPQTELIARTQRLLEATAAREQADGLTPSRRFLNRKTLMRIVSTVACLTLIVGLFSLSAPNSAYAEVVEKLRNASNIQYDSYTLVEGTEKRQGLTRTVMLSDGRMHMRTTGPTGDVVIIRNPQTGETMTINHQQKTVSRFTTSDEQVGTDITTGWLDWMRDLKDIDSATSQLPNRMIDGSSARGYEIELEDMSLEVWIDAKTGDLIEVVQDIDLSFGDDESDDARTRVVLSNFILNAKIDESLFAMTTPEGFSEPVPTQQLPKIELDAIKAVLRAVREYAEYTGGTLPPSVADFSKVIPQPASQMKDPTDPKEQERLNAVAMNFGMTLPILANVKSTEYGYLGKGLSTGDGGTLIFWIREEGTIRAIFDDLSTRTLSEEELADMLETLPSK